MSNLILCDFNDLEDNKTLPMLLPKGTPSLTPGLVVDLIDSDGNTCTGVVMSSAGRIATVEVNWLTWNPAPEAEL